MSTRDEPNTRFTVKCTESGNIMAQMLRVLYYLTESYGKST